jgi:prepilin-type N-terminal cleavage/methylation domain-containing protein
MRTLVRKLGRRQAGFTLVELLVVVGIIVGLAAVIVPSVAQFATRGDTGAQAAEKANVQAAFDTMMADNNITSVTAVNLATTGTAGNNFAALPAGTGADPLAGYLREPTTKYFYCWSAAGLVTEQFTSAVACTQ